jgi:uncharacterized membrane protein
MKRLTPQRLTVLDALRGFAMLWMTFYHGCFDLNHFGWIQQDFYNNPVWTWQRSAIVSLFLWCVGWSQAVASASPSVRLGAHKTAAYWSWMRWLQIALCAAAVTASSYVMYPHSFIYFGVLHAVCVMLLMLWGVRLVCARYLPTSPTVQLFVFATLGMLCFALLAYPPIVVNVPPFNVLGLISQKPITEDYVPLLPWFALVCWGYAFGLWQQGQQRAVQKEFKNKLKKGLSVTLNPFHPLVGLSKLGQYSLPYYMLHQPVLIGLLYLLNLGRLA